MWWGGPGCPAPFRFSLSPYRLSQYSRLPSFGGWVFYHDKIILLFPTERRWAGGPPEREVEGGVVLIRPKIPFCYRIAAVRCVKPTEPPTACPFCRRCILAERPLMFTSDVSPGRIG